VRLALNHYPQDSPLPSRPRSRLCLVPLREGIMKTVEIRSHPYQETQRHARQPPLDQTTARRASSPSNESRSNPTGSRDGAQATSLIRDATTPASWSRSFLRPHRTAWDASSARSACAGRDRRRTGYPARASPPAEAGMKVSHPSRSFRSCQGRDDSTSPITRATAGPQRERRLRVAGQWRRQRPAQRFATAAKPNHLKSKASRTRTSATTRASASFPATSACAVRGTQGDTFALPTPAAASSRGVSRG